MLESARISKRENNPVEIEITNRETTCVSVVTVIVQTGMAGVSAPYVLVLLLLLTWCSGEFVPLSLVVYLSCLFMHV